jgi:hypothetical protein
MLLTTLNISTPVSTYFTEFNLSCLGSRILSYLESTLQFRRADRSAFNDIYSGEKYSTLVDQRHLGQINQLSMNINYDSVARYSANNLSLYPLWATINEIPIEDRFKSKNIFLLGVYFGTLKPNPNVFLAPLIHQILQIEKSPPTVNIHGTLQPVVCTILTIIADLPARSSIMYMSQYNGKQGCTQCYQKGSFIERRMTFPYVKSERRRLRSCDHLRSILLQLESSTQKNVNGIKGFSVLQCIPHYDLFLDTSIEYMHCVFINTCKKLFVLWLKGIGGWKMDLNLLQPIIQTMKLPAHLSSFHVDITNWENFKAINWKYWLLYLNFPLFWNHQQLPSQLWNHWLRFLKIGVFLSCRSLSKNKLQTFREECEQFVMDHTKIFGKVHATINIHYFLHAAADIERFGLASSHSAFPYESMNGVWLNDHHGAQLYPKSAIINYENQLYLSSQHSSSDSPQPIIICPETPFTSPFRFYLMSEQELYNLNTLLSANGCRKAISALTYSMIKCDGLRIETEEYSAKIGTSNAAICWKKNSRFLCGIVSQIAVIENPERHLIFVVKCYKSQVHSFLHFKVFQSEFEVIVIPFQSSIQSIISFQKNQHVFFCQPMEGYNPTGWN